MSNPRFFPAAIDLARDIGYWIRTSGVWWGASVLIHAAGLAALAFIVVNVPVSQSVPLAFEGKVEVQPAEQPALAPFELGKPPVEPAELNTDTLTMTEAPQTSVADLPAVSPTPGFEDVGGGSLHPDSAALPGAGFNVQATGPGALATGPGGMGSGMGTGSRPGSGGMASGFGGRGEKMRREMLAAGGGTKGTERAVGAALDWFARHQMPDGSWSLNKFHTRCKGARCTGSGREVSDVGATAMALLPFLAAGQTHQTRGPHRQVIYRGLMWLVAQQDKDGSIRAGSSGPAAMYAHGIASITLCEAYALTKDKHLGAVAQRALAFTEVAQLQSDGGWRYTVDSPAGDTSVVGWQVMALKSGQMAGLHVSSSAMEKASKFLRTVASGQGGLFAYVRERPPTPTMTAVGLLCSQYLGAKRKDPAIAEGTTTLMQNLPKPEARDSYYWYYATQVLHNQPGPEWDTWNRNMRRVLIASQERSGCPAGSWNPDLPVRDVWGEHGGRIMTTSLCCLTLEVYYRYLPLYQLDSDDKSDLDLLK